MATVDLSQYGITGATEIVHNPSYDELYKEEMKADLEGYEKGQRPGLQENQILQLPKPGLPIG